jgi:hypothetical protein
MMIDDTYISIHFLSANLGLPKEFLQRLANANKIPSLVVNGNLKFVEQDVRDALREIAKEGKR